MRSDCILVKNEGQLIPDNVIEAVITTNPSSIGVASVDPNEGLILESDDSGTDLKAMKDHQADHKDRKVFYQFYNSTGKVATEDLQPFRTIVEDNVCGVACFLAGDFDVDEGDFSTAYRFHEQYVKPTVEAMWQGCDGSLDKLAEMLESTQTKLSMSQAVKPNKNTIVLLLDNGKDFMWTAADSKILAPWGFSSDSCGVSEVAPVETVKSEAPKPRFGRSAAATATPAPAPTDAPKADPVHPAGTPSGTEPQPEEKRFGPTSAVRNGPTASDLVAAGTATAIAVTWCVPNPNMGSKKRKDWYKEFNSGVVPENFEKNPPVAIPTERALKLPGTRTKILDPQPKEGQYRAFGPAMEEMKKNVGVTHLPPPKPQVNAVDAVKKVEAVLQASKPVTDPKDWEALEKVFVPLHQRAGVDEDRVVYASKETREKIDGIFGRDAIIAAWMHSDFRFTQVRQLLTNAMNELATAKAKLANYEKKEEPEAVTAEQPKKRFGRAAA